MAFCFQQDIVDDEGMYDERRGLHYDDALLEEFDASPEFNVFLEGGGDGGWLPPFLEYGRSYFSEMAWSMDARILRQLLLEIFPRKVSVAPESAGDIVAEQRAFWAFLGRKFDAEHAKACLDALDDRLTQELERRLGDSSNFGMAKSFLMGGAQAGFDVSTEAGLQSWIAASNAQAAKDAIGEPSTGPARGGARPRPHRSKKDKRKRKAARASRRRNRR